MAHSTDSFQISNIFSEFRQTDFPIRASERPGISRINPVTSPSQSVGAWRFVAQNATLNREERQEREV
jgi:hypothetical protein